MQKCIDPNWVFTARKRSLGQGSVFTPVCHFVHRGGGWSAPLYAGIHNPQADIPLGRHPPRQTPPTWVDTPLLNTIGCGQQAGGTYPTGMHSCCITSHDKWLSNIPQSHELSLPLITCDLFCAILVNFKLL